MQLTIDIPDEAYELLLAQAEGEGSSVERILLREVNPVLQFVREQLGRPVPRLSEPPFKGGIPGSLHLTSEMIDDILNTP